MKNACRLLIYNPEGKRSLGKPRCRDGYILELVLNKRNMKVWRVFILLSGDLFQTRQ
jgi:hypothetical protein